MHSFFVFFYSANDRGHKGRAERRTEGRCRSITHLAATDSELVPCASLQDCDKLGFFLLAHRLTFTVNQGKHHLHGCVKGMIFVEKVEQGGDLIDMQVVLDVLIFTLYKGGEVFDAGIGRKSSLVKTGFKKVEVLVEINRIDLEVILLAKGFDTLDVQHEKGRFSFLLDALDFRTGRSVGESRVGGILEKSVVFYQSIVLLLCDIDILGIAFKAGRARGHRAHEGKTVGDVPVIRRADLVDYVLNNHIDDVYISVEPGEFDAASYKALVENGVNIPAVCRSIMNEVRYVVTKNTGVTVRAVHVCVDSMTL